MDIQLIFRQRALATLRNGKTKKEVNEIYGLSNNVLKEWEELEKETGSEVCGTHFGRTSIIAALI